MLSKIMLLQLKSSPRLIILEQLRVQFLGEIPFLTGVRSIGIPPEESWMREVTVWYPLSEVALMAEFDSYEELKRAEAYQKVFQEEGRELTPGDFVPEGKSAGMEGATGITTRPGRK